MTLPPANSASPWRPQRWQMVLFLCCTLLVRGGWLVVQRHNLQADPDGYGRLAKSLATYQVLGEFPPQPVDLEVFPAAAQPIPTAFRPPLYPSLLALGVYAPGGLALYVALLHLTLGLLTVWVTVELGLRLGLGYAAFFAGALVALDPILLHQSTLLMTETTATFLAVLGLYCLVRCKETLAAKPGWAAWRRIALAGVVLALATRCRPTFLPFLLLAGLALVLRLPSWSIRWRAAGVYALAAGVVLLPWLIRNSLIFGKPILTTTHGGYTFHLANNPSFYDYLRAHESHDVWDNTQPYPHPDDPTQTLSLSNYDLERGVPLPADPVQRELVLDRLHYADAWETIKQQPAMFGYSILVRWGRLWQLLPQAVPRGAVAGTSLPDESTAQRAARYCVAWWYAGIYLLALRGAWVLGRQLFTSPWRFGTLLIASFMLVQALYWTDMRMRAPLMPALALLAAAGGSWLCMRMVNRNSLSHQ